ncbi:uncharacterized protein MONBRDRAFT_37396 [Monosiga brevicollis MX1]|uniref:Deoxyribodipyrimidine photo-lyase n=1 Tax=Monosiga brevicollis TaxID=81824 RepID=A9V1G3_MONBE|nr:uncharacterized protein MONBRDRAFT_37396 [Monosiga brevicollis MX1]EDQ88562.1 predicted protein [Monosiga brevicollis MX1]|eukprot:XP_001746666.1 hypothetical protein [Monosiga brevicollis MX1]
MTAPGTAVRGAAAAVNPMINGHPLPWPPCLMTKKTCLQMMRSYGPQWAQSTIARASPRRHRLKRPRLPTYLILGTMARARPLRHRLNQWRQSRHPSAIYLTLIWRRPRQHPHSQHQRLQSTRWLQTCSTLAWGQSPPRARPRRRQLLFNASRYKANHHSCAWCQFRCGHEYGHGCGVSPSTTPSGPIQPAGTTTTRGRLWRQGVRQDVRQGRWRIGSFGWDWSLCSAPSACFLSFVRALVQDGMFDDLLSDSRFAKRNEKPSSLGAMLKTTRMANEDPIVVEVEAWCEGKDNNIRALLGSLDIILWEGARWKPINIGVLTDNNQVRKAYQRACLVVHPDKLPPNNLPVIRTMAKAAKKAKVNTSADDDDAGHAQQNGSQGIPPGPKDFLMERVRAVTPGVDPKEGQCVLYWMSRDQRPTDNWALLYARHLAQERDVPLRVVFCLVPKFLEATIRQFGFMLDGLQVVETHLRKKHIPFHLLTGYAKDVLPKFAEEQEACAVVCDMSPLRVPMAWVKETGSKLKDMNVPLYQVDAHNIVPVWHASPKQEYAARTIRNKIHQKLDTCLQPFPELESNSNSVQLPDTVDWKKARESLEINWDVKEVDWLKPGYEGGMKMLEEFINERLHRYADDRNDPNLDALSNLSPYYHFGQISVQRVVLELRSKQRGKYAEGVKAYIEEAVVRRELSDNFCFYNHRYDSVEGASAWAQETLDVHSKDKREHLYTRKQLENAETADDLWNASQLQLVQEGKMHGFLRMYWAKKILEWTESPEKALEDAIYLNDKYELDGRDPNGYVGCMWSICGIHDQGWGERPVFGKIRYMNYKGCKRKFDIAAFVKRYPPAAKNAAREAIHLRDSSFSHMCAASLMRWNTGIGPRPSMRARRCK